MYVLLILDPGLTIHVIMEHLGIEIQMKSKNPAQRLPQYQGPYFVISLRHPIK